MIQTTKNINLIDLNKLIKISLEATNEYVITNNIKNSKDATTLFKHYFLFNFFEAYRQCNKSNIFLYFNESEIFDKIITTTMRIIFNKIKFPRIINNIDIDNFINLISTDCPEYDDITVGNYNFADKFKELRQYIKRSGLIALNNKFQDRVEITKLLIQSK